MIDNWHQPRCRDIIAWHLRHLRESEYLTIVDKFDVVID